MNTKSALSPFASASRRLTRFTFGTLLTVLVAVAALGTAQAQTATSAVPGLFNFQGKVANANGTLVGASPTPVNRTVTFRIWDHASASTLGNLIYSESQVVTITDGEFSVLIGQGSAVTGTPLGYNESGKGKPSVTIDSSSVFGGATRYLGITIDDGNSATTDPEVTPRQQLVTSAYAFRAKYAESVGSNGASSLVAADNGFVGIGAANPISKLEVAGNVRAGGTANASFVLSNPDNNTVGTVGTASSVGAFSSDAAVNDVVVRADAGKLLLQAGAGASALVVDTTNKVGVGTTTPGAKLEVQSTDALNTAFISNTGGGGGTQPALRVKVAATSGARNVIQAENNSGSVFVVRDDGFVGLGTSTPVAQLDVNGAMMIRGALTNASGRPAVGTGRIAAEIGGYGIAGAGAEDGFLRLSAGGGGAANTKTFIDLSGYSAVPDMDKNIVFGTASAERMRITIAGNVGVGTSAPSRKIHAVGAGDVEIGMQSTDANGRLWTMQSSGSGAPGLFQIVDRTANVARMVISSAGNVGIGTTAPGYPLSVYGGPSQSGMVGTYLNISAFGGPVTHGTHIVSLYSNGTILTGNSVIAASDQRVKSVIGRSNSAADLATIMQVEVTDYRHKDIVAKGNAPSKKVIAQQVEKIFPQAVRQVTDVIPDIYQPAKTEGDWIVLETDLKQSDRVKLVTDDGEKIYDVAEVRSGRFRTTERPKGEQIFVYGREVKDFRTVDYDAISMLNVSATQEIKREKDAEVKSLREDNAALRAANADLQARLAALETGEKTRDAKLAAIEKLLQSSQTVMARPAAPKSANGQQ